MSMDELKYSLISESSAVSFLIINNMNRLPEIAIKSVLNKCSAPIIIGYINDTDLPTNIDYHRIKLIKLNPPKYLSDIVGKDKKDYLDFSTKNFFQLVQLKWLLLEEILLLGYKYVIYSDTDVIWLKDPMPTLLATFESNPKVHWLMQSVTNEPSDVQLCMGFLAIKNSEVVRNFIKLCKEYHQTLIKNNPYFGDDNVVTDLFKNLNYPEFIRELPQVTFPVGNLLNLYSKKNVFPGLSGPSPYIFHANYAVGLKNKFKLLQVFNKEKRSGIKELKMDFVDSMFLIVSSLKHNLLFKRNK
jgi:hypothetical protein